ncbi:MAG: type I-B CRISPR-associated protein Cas7/Csh2 [Caldisericaceae bacterium]
MSNKENVYSKNSEILFIYDAKLCNPNGDPDNENKPRVDDSTNRNLVSDVRLKRYIRDYLESKGFEIFVAKVDGVSVSATERLKKFFEDAEKKVNLNNLSKEDTDFLLSKLIDVRLFGATMPIKASEKSGKGASSTFIGPVQFNWGYSLNKVETVKSSSITSTFSGREEKGEYGTFGKDWRLYYSLITFYGIVSGYRAEFTNLSEDDVKILDDALLNSIPKMATTRSKIGQTPRFILRVEYVDKETFLGDLRDFISINKEEGLRDLEDFEIDFSKLKEVLANHKEKINKLYVFEDPSLLVKDGKFSLQLKDFFAGKIEEIKS